MKSPAPKPCKECPMRRASLPGYLGADTPAHFIAAMHSDFAMPCHLDVDYEDPDWDEHLDDARQCSGQAIYLSNVCKRPRPVPNAAKTLPRDVDAVFSSPAEFLAHHTSPTKKSR